MGTSPYFLYRSLLQMVMIVNMIQLSQQKHISVKGNHDCRYPKATLYYVFFGTNAFDYLKKFDILKILYFKGKFEDVEQKLKSLKVTNPNGGKNLENAFSSLNQKKNI